MIIIPHCKFRTNYLTTLIPLYISQSIALDIDTSKICTDKLFIPHGLTGNSMLFFCTWTNFSLGFMSGRGVQKLDFLKAKLATTNSDFNLSIWYYGLQTWEHILNLLFRSWISLFQHHSSSVPLGSSTKHFT